MKHLVCIFLSLLLISCGTKTSEQPLEQRAADLCRYVPDDYELHWEKCREYLTPDFYALLDTMYHLPDISSVEHQWEWWFIASDGAPVFRCECQALAVERLDDTHAQATILVFPEDTIDYIADEHILSMERINGEWLMSDFDSRKADCRRYIDTNCHEWRIHQAVADYLVNETGAHYLQGEICIPVIQFVSVSDTCVHGDFWVYWYNICGDTLKTVSGGNHVGRMTLASDNGSLRVTAFEQTTDGAGNEASAKRIFGGMFDIYENIHSCNGCLETARENQLREYIRAHRLSVRYVQDFGWPAIDLNATE